MLRFSCFLAAQLLTLSACSSDSNTPSGDKPDAQTGAGGATRGQGSGGGAALDAGSGGTAGAGPDASLPSDGGAPGSGGAGVSGSAGTNSGAGGVKGSGGTAAGGTSAAGSGGVTSDAGTDASGNGGRNNGGAGGGGIAGSSGSTGSGGSGGAPDSGTGVCKPLALKLLNATDLDTPVYGTAPKGDSRIFVLERGAGRISILDATGKKLSTFLDISKKFNSAGFESGILALEFHPSFATNGTFYVTYTTASLLRVSRFTVPSATASVVDTQTESVVIETAQTSHHNTGGALHFGPDGMLYIAIGDADTPANGQDMTVINSKMLRIAVDPAKTGYTIPADNPFVSNATARHEIWALGLREPYRFWFDPDSKDLYIADVGDASHEEIDVVPAATSGGANFGWPIMEGTYCHTPATGCDETGLTQPVYDYPHTGGESAIIGASVYRGTALPACYRGSYLFGDYPSGRIDTLTFNGTMPVVTPVSGLADPNLVSFGVDGNGELLVFNYDESVYRIVSE
ncbi:MAG TPA: PQQ-dependent sugar dehydrogenase [Polyangiaceae bacterium]|jgi:hypothetical protein|nr:PQQ-dependent sugar dehydrogenase [Polyangiaceae bacterium]